MTDSILNDWGLEVQPRSRSQYLDPLLDAEFRWEFEKDVKGIGTAFPILGAMVLSSPHTANDLSEINCDSSRRCSKPCPPKG